MKADCHMHMALDGVDWKAAVAKGCRQPEEVVRKTLQVYRDKGYTYLRDGGDRWGLACLAKTLAPEYGITYRMPGAPLCRMGHYGMFIGEGFDSVQDYVRLVKKQIAKGADFIKIMASGIMDFHAFGVVTDTPMELALLRELVKIAHEEGLAVMVHANGQEAVMAAAVAGADSVEHGAYCNEEALSAMAETGAVWVPTLSAVGNLLKGFDPTSVSFADSFSPGRSLGRFEEEAVRAMLEDTTEKVGLFLGLGGLVAAGTDAGAWAVPHGCGTEEGYLYAAGAKVEDLAKGLEKIRKTMDN